MPSKRVAIVTGTGPRRVGWHVANALAERGYGLMVHYRNSAAEASELVERVTSRGIEAAAFQADLTDETAARELVKATLDHFGRIDVLVHCASVWRTIKFEAVTAADVREHFDANVLTTFLCAQHVGLAMVRQAEGGNIIFFGDWAEARPYADFAAYFASKGAVPVLTRSLAVELGTRNPRVRVNCILPGPVLFQPDLPESERQQSAQSTLVKREGKPENIVQAIMFLIENDFVTGICLPVDGGRTIFAQGH